MQAKSATPLKKLKSPGNIRLSSQGMLDMARVLIIYYSRSGNTEKMAKLVADGVLKEKKVEVEVKPVKDVQVEELLDADGIIIGSPTYYGSMASEIKKLLDDSIKFHGKLDGKIGGAFSSSGNIGDRWSLLFFRQHRRRQRNNDNEHFESSVDPWDDSSRNPKRRPLRTCSHKRAR